MNTVRIQEACDSVTIYVNENVKCHITQDDIPGMKLKELFEDLGFVVKYEEVY
jgi:hypothetical protein